MAAIRNPIIAPIIQQYVDDSAFLWIARDGAVREPHYTLLDLIKLDERIEAGIDGIRIAGEPGWEICRQALLMYEEAGEVFTTAVLAFESGDASKVDEVLNVAGLDFEVFRGFVSALGWLNFPDVEPWLIGMANATASIYRYTSIAAYAIHRVDPGPGLSKAIADEHPIITARALRAVGEFKRKDLLLDLHRFLESNDENCRFWSAWSALLLGDYAAIEHLKVFFNLKSVYFDRTIQLVLRCMDIATAQSWLQGLARFPDTLRHVIRGAGIVGDPAFMPWIISQMENEEVARVASEAFIMITGVDFDEENLEGEWPEEFEAGPTENPKDENVDMDPDEDLPWLEPNLVAQWWEKNKHRYQEGVRYLAGRPIAIEHCRHVLKNGYQRQRRAAALELTIRVPGEPLFNTSAPGKRQKQLLA
jgi:uncharacterized protein (TIGR02270 family)